MALDPLARKYLDDLAAARTRADDPPPLREAERVFAERVERRHDLDEPEALAVRQALHGTADGEPVPDPRGSRGRADAARRGRHGWSSHGVAS